MGLDTAIGAGTSTLVGEGLEKLTGTNDRSVGKIAVDSLVSGGIGGLVGKYVPAWDKIKEWFNVTPIISASGCLD